MQNRTILGELMVAKHKLAQVIQDQHIVKKYPRLAKRCFGALLGIEREIMSPAQPRRNKVLNGTNKHKSTRA
jgi:hypothetical protein